MVKLRNKGFTTDLLQQWSVQFSRSVVSDSLHPHELQHARPPCPSPAPEVYSNSCPSSQWCHLILRRPLLLLPPISPSIRVFSNESALYITRVQIVGWPYSDHLFIFTVSQMRVRDFSSVQSLSRVQLCDPMNCSTPGLPVYHQLPESTQTHVHCVSDAIQPAHPPSSPSPPAHRHSDFTSSCLLI